MGKIFLIFFLLFSYGFCKDEHVVLLKEFEKIFYFEDGSSIHEDEVFLKVLDKKGVIREQVQVFYQNRHYSELKIEHLEVIKKDGRRIDVDVERNSKEEMFEVEENIYDPNRKVLKVFVPCLSPGDVIHWKIKERRFKEIIPGQIYGMVIIQRDFPVNYYRLELMFPKEKRLKYLIKNKAGKVKFYHEIINGKKRLIWEFKDVPKLVPEPNMPPFHKVAMRLLFSTIPSWKDVSRWYFELVEPKLKPSEEIVKKVRQLIKGKDDMEKIASLYYFVSRKIRYLGIIAESKRPGFEPHDVNLTFTRKYGVCRDKAALLVCMLRIAGFRAAPVLVSIGERLDEEIVVPYFNHVIVAVLDELERPFIFLDPTSETSKQFLPDYDRNSSYLIAHKKGSYLGKIPPQTPEENLFLIKIKGRLKKDGSFFGKIEGISFGFSDTVIRSIFMNKNREEAERFLIRFLKGKRRDMKIEDIDFSDPDKREVNFHFSCSFKIKNATFSKGKWTFFWPISSTEYLGLLDRWILEKADMNRRRFPIRFGYVFASKIVEEIEFEEKPKRIKFPVMQNHQNKLFSLWTSFEIQDSEIKITRYLSLKKLEVPADEYSLILRLKHDLKYEAFLPIRLCY